jgi:hypothetical protein
MMAYAYPDGTYVSASWQSHKDRTPPSAEPGTDYGCAYGTPILAPDAGRVRYVQTSPAGGTGRYVWMDLDDGRSARALHLSRVDVAAGTRVSKGQRLGLSGASGYGSDYYYGPHEHQTLLPTTTTALAQSIDFALYVGTDPDPAPPKPKTEDEMILIEALPDRGRALVGPGYYRKIANSEELTAAAQLASKTLSGNARNFDVWKALCIQGANAAVYLTDDGVKAVADAVAARIPAGGTGGASPDQVRQIVLDALNATNLAVSA